MENEKKNIMKKKCFIFNLKSTGTILTIVIIGFVFCVTGCKKDESVVAKTNKIYWGNAIYNPSDITRDFSTYQSYPTVVANTIIGLQPKDTYLLPSKPADEMPIDSICNTILISSQFGYTYMNNITTLVKGRFTSSRTIKLDTCNWDNYKLVRGTIKLNEDNSIDVEYTDSIKDGTTGINHYSCHYTKHDK